MKEFVSKEAHSAAVTLRRPCLSVILPLGDSRRDAVKNITAWTERQTRHDFEIVAVSDGSDPVMETAVAAVLRPHDRRVTCPVSEHVLARLTRGAKQASASILLFAEHHCVPDPTCVDATIRFFEERPNAAAGVLKMVQRHGTRHGDLDQRWFAELEADWLRSLEWTKFRTGAFAMRKNYYFALGAHDGRYGLFADEVLSVQAHDAELVVGRITGSAVNHITATMRDHQHHVEDFTRGECAYRATQDREFCEHYFGYEHGWANRLAHNPILARSAATSLARVIVRDLYQARDRAAFRRVGALSRELVMRLPCAISPRAVLARAWIATRWSELRAVYLSVGHANRWKHFRNAWQRMINFARLSSAVENSGIPATMPMTPGTWAICDIPETQRAGFHGLEDYGGTPFRWSEPVMMVRVARPVGRTRVAVATAAPYGGPSRIRGVFWGGRPISDVEVDDGQIRFLVDITSPLPQWLVIVAAPLVAPNDRRGLGLPVSGLSFSQPK